MKAILMSLLSLFLLSTGFAQTGRVDDDLQIRKISDNVYLYVAWADIGEWGRVGSNGLIVVDGGRGFLVDTPMDSLQTRQLVDWVADSLQVTVEGFVPGHWHSDCVGGMEYLKHRGVKTYANKLTNDILASKGRPQAAESFSDSIALKIGKIDVQCYYLGGGHATDNIVVWLPSEKILFGGCMIKDCSATSLGNVEDAASREEWSATVKTIADKFADAQIIVPGHGEVGGAEILDHTEKLLKQ